MTALPHGFDSQEFIRDPYPTYAFLRKHQPVIEIKPGHYAIMRYEDVKSALMNFEVYVSGTSILVQQDWMPEEIKGDLFILSMDRPKHPKYKKIVQPPFVRSAVESLRERVVAEVNGLVKNIKKDESFEVLSGFSYPLVGSVIKHLLGMERLDLEELRRRLELRESVTQEVPSKQELAKIVGAVVEQRREFLQLIEERKRNPKEDIVTALIGAKIDHAPLEEAELLSALDLLLSGGAHTTSQVILAAVLHFSQSPEVFKLLKNDPGLIKNYIEELLRLKSPQHFVLRRTAAPISLHGFDIPENSLVSLAVASANRDEQWFKSPDQIDLYADNKHHLTFGFGPHKCLGHFLARLELEVALGALVSNFNSFESCEEVSWTFTTMSRVIRNLPMRIR